MKTRAWIAWALCVVATAAFAMRATAQQAEPSVDQVYQAARSGQLTEARSMVDQVVRNHPDSGKAHYVRAEIAARQGDAAVAQEDLAQAERLSPGLPFAKPDAVQALRTQVQRLQSRGSPATTSNRTAAASGGPAGATAPAPAERWPWGKLLVGAVVVFGILAVLLRRRTGIAGDATRASPTAGPVVSSGGMPAPGAYPGGSPQGPYGAYPPQGPYGAPAAAPGMGSTLGRGLATGLAVGAGAVAAQELGHRLLHGRDGPVPADDALAGGSGNLSGDLSRFDDPNRDMGGQDFGIQDPGSWDAGGDLDSGDVGGNDWDNS